MHAVTFANLVNVCDVRMVQCRSRCCFLFESTHPIAIANNIGGQNLQSNFAMKLSVLRQVHLTHSARTKLRADFIATELCARAKSHRLKSAVQLSTTVIGVVILSSGTEATRKRWPSAPTMKKFLGPGRPTVWRRSANSSLGAAASNVDPFSFTSTAMSFRSDEM